MDEIDNIRDDYTWTISDRYVVMDRIGTGGMAEIFRAKMFGAAGFEKEFAIKLIRPHLLDDEEFVEMFVNEAKLSVALYHTNIVQVFDFGIYNERYYIVMEYVEGKDLLDILARCVNNSIRIPLDIALHIVMEMLKGLDFAHRATDVTTGESLNIIHRDISPSNVLVSYTGGIKIGDFGVAKARLKQSMSRTGTLKGKVGYMSPEQVIGDPIDYRSDIFAAGIILYETISMSRLFRAENDFGTMLKVRDCDLDEAFARIRPLPSGLETILRKALAKNVHERYQTAGAFFQDLSHFCYQNRLIIDNGKVSNIMRRLFSSDIERQKRKRATEQTSLKYMRSGSSALAGLTPRSADTSKNHNKKEHNSPKPGSPIDMPDIPSHSQKASAEPYPASTPRIPNLSVLEAAQKKLSNNLDGEATEATTDPPKSLLSHEPQIKPPPSREPSAELKYDSTRLSTDSNIPDIPDAPQHIKNKGLDGQQHTTAEPISLLSSPSKRIPAALKKRTEDSSKTDKNNATALFQDNNKTSFASYNQEDGEKTSFGPGNGDRTSFASNASTQLPIGDPANYNNKTSLAPLRPSQPTLSKKHPRPHITRPTYDTAPNTSNEKTDLPSINPNRQFKITNHPLEIPDPPKNNEHVAPLEDFPFASLDDISDEISTSGHIHSQSELKNAPFSANPSPPLSIDSIAQEKSDPEKEQLRARLKPYHNRDFFFRDLEGRVIGPLEGNQLYYFITSTREGELSFDAVEWEPMQEFSAKITNEISQIPYDDDTKESLRKNFESLKPSTKPKRPPLPPPFNNRVPKKPIRPELSSLSSKIPPPSDLEEFSAALAEERNPSEVSRPPLINPTINPSLPVMDERHETAHNGSFSEVSFTRLMYRLLKSHQTGRLLLTTDEIKKELYFEKGRPVSMMSNLDHERLGDFLLERKLITKKDLENALQRTKKWGGRLGDSLVAINVIPSYQIVNYLRMQFEEKLLDIFGWTTGEYQFFENQVTSERNHALNLDLYRMIADGCFNRISYDFITNFYANRKDKSIQLTEHLHNGLERFKLKPSAIKIARSFKDGDSLFEIESRTPEDKLELTYRLLYLLHQVEFIFFENTDRVESPGFYFDTETEV